MTTDEYVPSDQAVRASYRLYMERSGIEDADAEFDRFLARVRREAAREALDGLAAEAREGIVNRETTWGHGQAIAAAAETYRDSHCPEETP